MIQLSGKRLAGATLLVQLAVLCLFFGLMALLLNFETVALSPWGYAIALGAAVLALDTLVLFFVFRCRSAGQ